MSYSCHLFHLDSEQIQFFTREKNEMWKHEHKLNLRLPKHRASINKSNWPADKLLSISEGRRNVLSLPERYVVKVQESQFFLRFSWARCHKRWHKINPDRCSLRYWGERVSKHLVTPSPGIFGKHSFVPYTGTGPEHFVYNRGISFLASVLLWVQALCFWVKFSWANDDRSLWVQAQIGYQTNDKLSSTLSEQFIFVGQVLLSY